jgi:hypothetical protein
MLKASVFLMSSFLGDPTRLVTGALAGRRSRGRREGLIDVNQGNRRRIDGECLSEYRGPAPNHREVFENGCDSAGAFGTVRGRAGTDFFVCAARMLAIVDRSTAPRGCHKLEIRPRCAANIDKKPDRLASALPSNRSAPSQDCPQRHGSRGTASCWRSTWRTRRREGQGH